MRGNGTVIQHVGRDQRILAIVQLGKGNLGIRVDEGLLINSANALDGADVLGIALAQGVSPSSLLGWHHPPTSEASGGAVYSALYFPRGMILASILVFAMAASWHFKRKLMIRSDLLGSAKAVTGVVLILTLFLRLKFTIVIILPLLPLLYWRTEEQVFGFDRSTLTDLFPRLMLSTMIAFQFLQAYPVTSDQLFIAFAPAAIWACVLIFDAFQDLARQTKPRFGEIVSLLKKPALISALTLSFAGVVLVEAR